MSNEKNFYQADNDARTNAYFGNVFGPETWKIMDGYALGAKFLIEKAIEEHERDTLIYPVCFLFRHYIEIAIKETYIKLKEFKGEVVDRQKIGGHNLDRKELHEMASDIKELWEWEEFPQDVVEIIKSVDEIDSNGQFFKYTHDRQGNPLRDESHNLIGYQALYEKIETVYKFFNGLNAALDHYIEVKAEMEAEARQAMYEHYGNGDY
ncbi:hypothetical protein [Brevibacillus centrosporus]|uniref:hypothetical protein n=1 Tax=Brevibacillus centrosporus TaxID=54910 RepID=UPI003826A95F